LFIGSFCPWQGPMGAVSVVEDGANHFKIKAVGGFCR
jgi:hypothetical protein